MHRKFLGFFSCILVILSLFGCASAAKEGQNLLAKGDYVGAIEVLSQRLIDKPGDKDAIPVFKEIYPSYPDKLIASLSDLTGSAASNTADADKLVKVTSELLRIQNAVRGLPSKIGDSKQGWTEVRKYDDDFEAKAIEAKKIAARAYYAEAGKTFPGASKSEKESLLKLYAVVLGYDPDFKDTKDRGAQLCYEIAGELEKSESVSDLEGSIKWLQEVNKWVASYKDTASKLQTVSYDVASKLKADGTVPSYEKAASYFKVAGNFKNAPAEVQVFDFYKKVASLSNEAKSASGNNSLKTTSSSSGTKMQMEIQPRTEMFAKKAVVKAESSAFSIFNPRSDVVYIGAIVDGKSVADETFKPILASRAPLKITIDLANIKGEASTVISDPGRYSESQAAIKRIVNQGTTDTIPVRAQYRYEEVKSSEMLNIALGVGVGKGDISITSNTNIDTSSNRSSTLIELTQVYYTVNIDIPSKSADFFATAGSNIVSPSLLESTTPYYVSSVTYGRRAYFLLQSDESSKTIQEQIEFAKEAAENNPIGTSLNIDTSVKNTLTKSKTTITSHVLGGSGSNAVITSLEGMMQWIHDGMDASKNLGTAVPIGFVMRSLKDNGIAVVEQAGSVTLPAQAKITVQPHSFIIDYADNPKTLVRLYISDSTKMTNDRARKDPDIKTDKDGWFVSLNNGDNFFPVGNGNKGKFIALQAKPYTAYVSSGNDRIYLGANLGDRSEVTVLGMTKGKNAWAGYQSFSLSAEEIAKRTDPFLMLYDQNNGWTFKGANFQGRYFFDIKIEAVD